jgi:hypothetical protein
VDRAIEVQRKRWLQKVESDAVDAAKEMVLAEHAADVEKYRLSFRTAQLPTEPNWQDMLKYDDED